MDSFLIYLGAKTFVGTPADKPAEAGGHTLPLRACTPPPWALTMDHDPSTILSFVAIFAGVGVGTGGHAGLGAVLLVLGVWSGSAAWWVILSTTFAVLRTKVTSDQLRWINRLSVTILIVFGLVAFCRAAWPVIWLEIDQTRG